MAGTAWPVRAKGHPGVVFQVPDGSETVCDPTSLLGATKVRDMDSLAELRAEALLDQNRGVLRDFGVEGYVRRHRGEAQLVLRTGNRVGAIPLLSPATGRPDHALLVQPRFAWSGIGEVLATTGFAVVPHLLPLPSLPTSERRVPAWVLSSIVLHRIEALLTRLQRRFAEAEEVLRAPRGTVRWDAWARQHVAVGRPNEVPCRFPDLRDDRELLGVIHHVLRLQLASLTSQATAGSVVRTLLDWCDRLLRQVQSSPPRQLQSAKLQSWHRQPMTTRVFREGLDAMAWTLDERGLAGPTDLEGLPWSLDMEVFFEAWIEALAARLARRIGGRVRSGRKGTTQVPLQWRPAWAGSQRSLIPDVVVEREDVVIVFDAKYKAHFEALDRFGWPNVSDVVREAHRADLLQVLAYSTLYDAPRVVACLAYPCRPEHYRDLVARDRALMRAQVPTSGRQVELALVAVPMAGDVEAAVAGMARLVAAAS